MTHKSTKMGMTAFACFYLLLTTAIAESCRSVDIKSIAEIDVLSKTMEVAPDILDDRQFVTASLIFNSSCDPCEQNGLLVQLVGPNKAKHDCFFPSIIALPLAARRLSYKSVVLTYLENDNEGPVRLALINTKYCNFTQIYDEVLPLNDLEIFTSSDPSDERFAMIAYGKQYCRGHNWCRLFFDPLFQKFEPLDFDFPGNASHVRIQPATTFDGDLLIVRHTDTTNTHRMRLYDLSSNRKPPSYKDLLTLPVYKSDGMIYGKLEPAYVGIVLHGLTVASLSYCWRKAFDVDPYTNRVHCSRVDENGTLLLNETVFFRQDAYVLNVQPIENGMVVFSANAAGCSFCQTLQVTVITSDAKCIDDGSDLYSILHYQGNEASVTIKRRQYNVGCVYLGESLKIRIDEATGSMEIEYLCRDDARIAHRILYEN